MKKTISQVDLDGVLYVEKLRTIIVKNKDNQYAHICVN